MARILTPEDVAARLGVCRKTALGRMKREMRCVNVGLGSERGRWVVDERDFERWLEGQKQVPALAMEAKKAPKKSAGRVVPMFYGVSGPIPYRHSGKKAKAK